jgi:hypothetical protein
MNTVAELTLQALQKHGTERLPGYTASLCTACNAYPPPFGMEWYGEKYREAASDPDWLAMSLIANAAKEGEGAQKLWGLAGRTANHKVADQIRVHAIDEARHARLYIAMLDTAFPGAVSEEIRPTLMNLSPGYSSKDQPPASQLTAETNVLDELIQMNIGEIRTRIHQLLLRPVLTIYCPIGRRGKLTQILDSILEDETRHIEYTARLIEQGIIGGFKGFIHSMMTQRLNEFNQITLNEIGKSSYD